MKSYKEELLMIAKQILEETEVTDIDEIEINVDEEFGETSIVLRKHDEDDEPSAFVPEDPLESWHWIDRP